MSPGDILDLIYTPETHGSRFSFVLVTKGILVHYLNYNFVYLINSI